MFLIALLWLLRIIRAYIIFFSANSASIAKPRYWQDASTRGEKHALTYPHSKAGTIPLEAGRFKRLIK
jgi:hypothetical protein